MSSDSRIRRWLQERPWPVSVRCDGKTIVRLTSKNTRWSQAETAMTMLGCHTAEALNEAGEILRVIEIDSPVQTVEAVAEETAEQKELLLPESWPEGEQAQLARIIVAASDRAAFRHERAWGKAFETVQHVVSEYKDMLKLVLDRLTQSEQIRLDSIEAREVAADDALELAHDTARASNGGGGSAEALLGTVAQGALLRMAGPTPQPKKEGA